MRKPLITHTVTVSTRGQPLRTRRTVFVTIDGRECLWAIRSSDATRTPSLIIAHMDKIHPGAWRFQNP